MPTTFSGNGIRRKITSCVILLIVAFTVLRAFPLSEGAIGWVFTTIESTVNVGIGHSIAVDSCCNVYVSYLRGSRLMLAKRISNVWSSEIVVTAVGGGWTSIALDSSGNPHICFTSGQDLWYVAYNGVTWDDLLVDTVTVGEFRWLSLALGSSDTPHLSYTAPDGIKYARWNGISWDITLLQSMQFGNGYSSLALDSSDYPHVTYAFGSLWYRWWDGATWNTANLDPGTLVFHTSLALDSLDRPHISYHVDDDDTLRHALLTGGSWTQSIVDASGNVGWGNSIAVDSADNSHIAYLDMNAHSLKYAVGDGVSWSIETVESVQAEAFSGTAIALDSNDSPNIIYKDVTPDPDHLKHAGPLGIVFDLEVSWAGSYQHYVSLGNIIIIQVELINLGTELATFNATAYANKTLTATQEISLESGTSTSINLTWSSKPFAKGNYTIDIMLDILPCEVDVEDNSYEAGQILITISGDVDGDRDVDIFDIVQLSGVYGKVPSDPEYDSNCDIDGDGDIDIFDVVLAAGNYGESW